MDYGSCDVHEVKIKQINLNVRPTQVTSECVNCGLLIVEEPPFNRPERSEE
jgi:23S rRNA A2030 N6-methylase RlmJ